MCAPFDFGCVLATELEVGSDDDGDDLIGSPEADDRAVDSGVGERPSNGGRSCSEPPRR